MLQNQEKKYNQSEAKKNIVILVHQKTGHDEKELPTMNHPKVRTINHQQ
jgi:hypothetical protein